MGSASPTPVDVLAPAFRRTAKIAAAVVALTGLAVLIGWVLDLRVLRDLAPLHGSEMKPNEALGFILSGAALWMLQAPGAGLVRRVVGLTAAAAAALLGAATLLQDVSGVDLGIDQLVLADEPWAAETGAPGRMSPNASLALTLAGTAIVLLPVRGWRVASFLQFLATIVGATGLLAVLGYLYDVEGLHRLEYGVTGISIETAAAFIVLGLGLLGAAPERGWMTVFSGATFGGFVARRLLPAVTLVVVLFGWLRLIGEQRDLFDAALGTALLVLSTVLLLGGLVWHTSVALHRSDLKRLNAQRDLLEQREWLTTTLLSIGDAVITTDDRGRIVLLNAVAERLTGWSQEEAAGLMLREVFRIVDESTGRLLEDPVAQVLRDGDTIGLANHTALVRRDGALIPIQDSAAPIRQDGRTVVGVVLVFRDVSVARRAEQELRASEAVKSAIIGNSLDGLVTMDADGRIVEFNPAAEAMFGYRREEALGRELADMIVPQTHRESHRRGLARFVATGESGVMLGRHIEVPAVRRDGTVFPVELAVTPIPTGGRPMFAGHLRDITERKRIQEALEQRASQQRAVVRLGQMALRERDLDKVLQQGTATLAATLEVEFSKVLQLVPGRQEMVMRSATGFDADLIGRATVPAGPDTQAGYTITRDAPLVVDDLRTERRFRGAPLLHDHGVVSGMTCTIVGPGGEPWGVLGAHSTRRRAFTEDDISFLGAVANVLANAIERDEAEASLRRSERLYRGIGESMDYGVWVCAPDGRALYSSPSFQRMTGLTPEQASGFGWAAALDPDQVEDTVRAWKETVATGGYWEREHRYLGIDGRWHYVLARGVPIRDDDGNVIYWAGINLDIDNFKRTEDALRRSEERFREIAETIREVFYVVEGGAITYVSSAYEAVWGRPRHELYEHPDSFMDAVVEEDRASLREAIRRRAAGQPTDVEYRISVEGGDQRWIHDKSFPVFDEHGRLVRIVGVANDVTERKRHEEQMQTVMGELNHRVKNTLAVIQSIALQTARRAPNLQAFQKSFQDRLISMANAHSLLTQTHWEGASLLDIVNSELNPRVASSEQYYAAGPAIRLRPKSALALHMVVHELATNAGKYGALSSEQGRVSVEWSVDASDETRQVTLVWTERSPAPVEPPSETGYGTRLIDQMIQYELDGNVEREYRPEGLRCVVRFALSPRDIVAGAPPSASSPILRYAQEPESVASEDGDCRVLVVEDNSMLAMTLCEELSDAGFNVIGPAASLARGLALSERHEIDAAVLDVDLDGTAVYPLARRLRERNIPYVLVTGYEVSDLPVDLRDSAMLRKPVQVERVRAFLEHELRPV